MRALDYIAKYYRGADSEIIPYFVYKIAAVPLSAAQ